MFRLGMTAALLAILAPAAHARPTERNFWEWVQDPNGAEIRVVLARAQENLTAAPQGEDDPVAIARLEDARGMLRFGLRLEPDHPRLLYAMGQVCDQLGRTDEVVAALEHYLQVEMPDRVVSDARFLLGRAHARRGDLRAAIAQLIQAAARGDNSAAVLALAEVYQEVGRLDDAIDVLETQTRRRAYFWGGEEIVHLALAVAYDRDDQLVRARDVIERLVGQRQRIIDVLRVRGSRTVDFWLAADRHYAQAYVYELAGYLPEARSEWQHYVRLGGRHRARALAHVRAIDAGRPMPPATPLQVPIRPPRPPIP